MEDYEDCHYYESDFDDFDGCPITKRMCFPRQGSECMICPYRIQTIRKMEKESEEKFKKIFKCFTTRIGKRDDR